jgi:hypothetical protein
MRGYAVMNFNRSNLADTPLSTAINAVVEQTVARKIEQPRPYLGASIAGQECLRRVQYDWWCTPSFPARTKDIFARGHFFEAQSRQHLIDIGFVFAPSEVLGFTAVDGAFRGHADGIIIHGPNLPGIYLNFPFLWEHKAINAKGWRALERDGLAKAYLAYYAQCQLYMAYLDLTNPLLFTALNADTCERVHFFVPFDAERAQAFSDRLVAIIEATRVSELLPRITEDQSDFRCKMCSHRERCWGAMS